LRPLAQRAPFFYGWVIVAVAFVTMAVGVNARTAFSLFMPPLIAEFGWERGVTAGAFSFGFLLSAFGSPVLGRLMDRHGPLVVIESGVLLMGAGLLLAAHIRAPWHLYMTLGTLVGLGGVCLGYTGQGLYLPNWFVRRRGLATSIAYSGAGAGSIMLLPWLQATMVGEGWRAAATSLGLLVLAALLPLNLLVRRRPEDLGLAPDGDGTAAAPTPRPSNVVDPAWAAIDWTLGRAARTARFWWIAAAFFASMFSWYLVQVHQTKYLVEIGFAPMTAAWALGWVSLIAIPGQIALGHLSDRVGREGVWAIGNGGFVLCYACLIAMRTHPDPLLLWLMVAAQGFLGYGLTSVIGAIVAEIFQGRHFGVIFGTLMGIGIAGGALGPWAAGALHDRGGDYSPAFLLAIAASIAATLAVWRAAPREVRSVAGRTPH
jgi:MFS family permease